MQSLAKCILSFVERHFSSELARDPKAYVRPVIIGPPDSALHSLYSELTLNGQNEWKLSIDGKQYEIVVALVDSINPPSGTGLSRGCHWDYAVSLRNSRPLALILSSRNSWDKRPESISNTTETLGGIHPIDRGEDDSLRIHIIKEISRNLEIEKRQVKVILRIVSEESAKLEPAKRDSVVWEVINDLLSTRSGISGMDMVCHSVGLPPIGTSSIGFSDAYVILRDLGIYASKHGVRTAIDSMKNTAIAISHDVGNSLESLYERLITVLNSPTAFAATPSYYYRIPSPIPDWYRSLTADILGEILKELEPVQSQERLIVKCSNPIVGIPPIHGIPIIVESSPNIIVSSSSGTPIQIIQFYRKVDREQEVLMPASPTNPNECIDISPPIHGRSIKYRAQASGHRDGIIDVLIISSFECGGLVAVRDAEIVSLPSHSKGSHTWSQEITLLRSGITDIVLIHRINTALITISRDDSLLSSKSTIPGSHTTAINIDIEDGDDFQIKLFDSSEVLIADWILKIIVKDISDTSSSRLDALIKEHRTKIRSIPHPPDTALHKLEISSYYPSEDSWKPVLACWESTAPNKFSIDWSSDRKIGDTSPPIDPRPQITPPLGLLNARNAIRILIKDEQRCASEIHFENETFYQLAINYLNEFMLWQKLQPDHACWFDVLAIHTAEWNSQAGCHVSTVEPVVVLLSPMHPLRLAWHVLAQTQLYESRHKLCPAAGLISPGQCPDSAVIHIFDGQSSKPRTFFSLPCDHPHWVVLVNTSFLDKTEPRFNAMLRLAELGLTVQTITGGFTSQQTQDSLKEVNRLLPARATLRIGIIGDRESSSECGDGVFQWSEQRHSDDETVPAGCLNVEIFDLRNAKDPSPEQISDLSELSSERVRWFKISSTGEIPRLDLTIIDQLGARTYESSKEPSRSVLAPGCLLRVRIREDFQDARAIIESRVATTRISGLRLSDLLPVAVCQYEFSAINSGTHFKFTPNQDAIGTRLNNSTFLSVTSSQVDHACIVRGSISQGGFLWNYELPGVLGGGESNLGYYLVASPTKAMSNAIEKAASLVLDPPPNAHGLLDEISKHGIPILKRLAGGGSQSKGELGLLLATRLIQDVFRPRAFRARLPVWHGDCIHLVLPVDPYQDLFSQLRRSLRPNIVSDQRPDLIIVAMKMGRNAQPVSIKITPVEVKYRANGMPSDDMREALTQAENLGKILSAVFVDPSPTELWKTCSSALLALFIDFGFRIYAGPWLHNHTHIQWENIHESIIRDILEGKSIVSVNTSGRLIVFDGSPLSETSVFDLDADGRRDTIIVSIADSRLLLEGTRALSNIGESSISQMDFSFPDCGITETANVPLWSSAQVPITLTTTPGMLNVPTSQNQPTMFPNQSAPINLENVPIARTTELHNSIPSTTELATSQPSRSRVPAEVRLQVRDAFQGFIANDSAVLRLSNDMLRALIEQPPHLSKNYLFTGLPSTGKTELARRVARGLRLPFIKLDGRSVSSRDRLFDLINGELNSHNLTPTQIGQSVGLPVIEYPPLIVFIDEVHLVPRVLQESLLTMLEAADRTVVLSEQVAHMNRATFLFATTRLSDVDSAFVSRCDEIQLTEYTQEEVAKILQSNVPHLDWTIDIYKSVARIGRCVPRIAIQLAEALETAILVSEETKSPLEHLSDVRRAREIDDRGLTRTDFEYLNILERAPGSVGEQNILNLIRSVDKDRILNEIEPFLVRLGFIKHGQRGRELTAEGRTYLLDHRTRNG